MISTDFAPNETKKDAWESLKLILQPGKWLTGNAISEVASSLHALFPAYLACPLPRTYLTGRAALHSYLTAVTGSKRGSVAIQAFTCTAVVLPILKTGNRPIFVDIERETYSMDDDDLVKKLTPDTKVIILQHTYGITPKNRQKIIKLAHERSILLIEDLAHGWDPTLFDQKTQEKPQSTLLLSFGRSKALSSVFGGALLTPDTPLAEKLKKTQESLRYPARAWLLRALLYKPLALLICSTYDIFFGKALHRLLRTFNLLIPEISPQEKTGAYDPLFEKSYPNALATLLLIQLNRYQTTMKKRSDSVNRYREALFPEKTSLRGPLSRLPYEHKNAHMLGKYFAKKHIFLGNWYNAPIGGTHVELKKLGYASGSCPVAESISSTIINLPTGLSKKDEQTIISALQSQKWKKTEKKLL